MTTLQVHLSMAAIGVIACILLAGIDHWRPRKNPARTVMSLLVGGFIALTPLIGIITRAESVDLFAQSLLLSTVVWFASLLYLTLFVLPDNRLQTAEPDLSVQPDRQPDREIVSPQPAADLPPATVSATATVADLPAIALNADVEPGSPAPDLPPADETLNLLGMGAANDPDTEFDSIMEIAVEDADDAMDLTETEQLYEQLLSENATVELPNDPIWMVDPDRQSGNASEQQRGAEHDELPGEFQGEFHSDVHGDLQGDLQGELQGELQGDLQGDKHDDQHTYMNSDSTAAEPAIEADSIIIDADIIAEAEQNAADLTFGDALTGEYAHPDIPQTPAPELDSVDEALVLSSLAEVRLNTQLGELQKRLEEADKLHFEHAVRQQQQLLEQTDRLIVTEQLVVAESAARQAAEDLAGAQQRLLLQTRQQQRTIEKLLQRAHASEANFENEVARSRAMAREAASVARKAALQQQSIRQVAKRELALRLKSEASARKAVNIARSAISALSAEDRNRKDSGI